MSVHAEVVAAGLIDPNDLEANFDLSDTIHRRLPPLSAFMPPPRIRPEAVEVVSLDAVLVSPASLSGLSVNEVGGAPPPPESEFIGPTSSVVPAAILGSESGPAVRVEDAVPERVRWWAEAVERYACEKVSEGEWNQLTADERESDIKAWPARLEAAGLGRPLHLGDLRPESIVKWKANPIGPGGTRHHGGPHRMDDSSADSLLIALRGFARWGERVYRIPARQRFAEKKSVWKHRRGPAKNRRWLTVEEIDLLVEAAPAELKPMIALAAWVGLRRREAWSLECGKVELAVDARSVSIVRKGGDPDMPPIPVTALNLLRPAVMGREAGERVYPMSLAQMDKQLRALGYAVLGKAVSFHDLRRSFGRNLYYVHHVDIAVIAALYHHKSTAMTLYYIGATDDMKREAVSAFDRPRLRTRPDVVIARV
jgi:integrase